MSKKRSSQDSARQMSLFGEEEKEPTVIRPENRRVLYDHEGNEVLETIPPLVLPTRWEYLQPKISDEDVWIRTIITPVYPAMNVLRDIIESIKTTGGARVLVIRADTGSGKTTFLNTLHHYMQDIAFHTQTIDLQPLAVDEFSKELWSTTIEPDGINLIILEGREKPADISDEYIQVVLANINRFSRTRRAPILFVIPTIEESVARNWCQHGSEIGDLIPENQLFEGSRWYRFQGVPQEKYVEIAEETIRVLNPPYSLSEYGVSLDEAKTWANNSSTIGEFIGTLADNISARRAKSRFPLRGPRERVWVVFCAPDNRHYDHTYHIIHGLVLDDKLRASPVKLVPPRSDSQLFRHWRMETEWTKLVNAINFLDIRIINLPITTIVSAALAYADEQLLQSFKDTTIAEYRDKIPEEMISDDIDWSKPLAKRRLQVKPARASMESSNLYRLLRQMPAEPLKGGNPESAFTLAQYLHLREKATPEKLHFYLGKTLKDLLTYQNFPGYQTLGTETPLVQGQRSPLPDVTIFTDTDTYALEFHFLRKQIVASEIQNYTLKNVVEKYVRDLPHLRSQLDGLGNGD